MKNVLRWLAVGLVFGSVGFAREYHVSLDGDDANSGSVAEPFWTISRAAQVAQPGDVAGQKRALSQSEGRLQRL